MKAFLSALGLGFIEAIAFVYFYACYYWWHDTPIPMDVVSYLLFIYTIWITVILYFGKFRKKAKTESIDKKVEK